MTVRTPHHSHIAVASSMADPYLPDVFGKVGATPFTLDTRSWFVLAGNIAVFDALGADENTTWNDMFASKSNALSALVVTLQSRIAAGEASDLKLSDL